MPFDILHFLSRVKNIESNNNFNNFKIFMSKFKTYKAKKYQDRVYFLNISMKFIESLCIKKMFSLLRVLFTGIRRDFPYIFRFLIVI